MIFGVLAYSPSQRPFNTGHLPHLTRSPVRSSVCLSWAVAAGGCSLGVVPAALPPVGIEYVCAESPLTCPRDCQLGCGTTVRPVPVCPSGMEIKKEPRKQITRSDGVSLWTNGFRSLQKSERALSYRAWGAYPATSVHDNVVQCSRASLYSGYSYVADGAAGSCNTSRVMWAGIPTNCFLTW